MRSGCIYIMLSCLLVSATLTGISLASEYTVGKGDVISVDVFKEKDFSGDFAVDPKGNLNYPVVGDIQVEGKSVDGIKETLVSILAKDYLVNPRVTVSVKQYNSKKVTIIGSVLKPGIYVLTEQTKVLDLISLAGGINKEGSSKIIILRKEKQAGEPALVQTEKKILEKDETQKSPAQAVGTQAGSGSVIPETVPSQMKDIENTGSPVRAENKIVSETVGKEEVQKNSAQTTVAQADVGSVTSEADPSPAKDDKNAALPAPSENKAAPETEKNVKTEELAAGDTVKTESGPVPTETSSSSLKDIAGAESLAPIEKTPVEGKMIAAAQVPGDSPVEGLAPSPVVTNVKLPAASVNLKPIIIDYSRILKGDLTNNIEIQAGDIINVQKANEVFVLGSVKAPGHVKYEDGMGVLQAVSMAGGPTSEAAEDSTYVLRIEQDGKEQKIPVKLGKILKQKAKNIDVRPSDVIYVPESFF